MPVVGQHGQVCRGRVIHRLLDRQTKLYVTSTTGAAPDKAKIRKVSPIPHDARVKRRIAHCLQAKIDEFDPAITSRLGAKDTRRQIKHVWHGCWAGTPVSRQVTRRPSAVNEIPGPEPYEGGLMTMCAVFCQSSGRTAGPMAAGSVTACLEVTLNKT